MKSRFLGLDFGDRRIGVAVSDEMGWTAQGVMHIDRKSIKEDLNQIEKVMTEYGNIGGFVIGMPFNMDGSEGPRVDITRKFVEALEKRFNLPVHEVDERWSSLEAERLLIDEADMSRNKRKGKVDKIAAQLILQTFLERHKQ